MGQTISEKVLSRVMGRRVTACETIYPEPDLVTVHDWYVVNFDRALQEFGVTRLYDAKKVLISTDHEPVATTREGAERQQAVRRIVAKYGIEHFYDTGRGGHGHVFPMEMGYIRPGMFVLAYDTHVTNYGAVGCLGVPMVVEISEVLACGSVWVRVPETVRINLSGQLPRGVTVRDLAQRLTIDLDSDLIDYSVVEYGGPGLATIGHGGRQTLCNTPLEIGAKSALVEPDQFTLEWLAPRVKDKLSPVVSDGNAQYRAIIDFDMSGLEPQVAAPPRPDNVVGVATVTGTPIQHAFVGSCANCSLEDLRDAARILKGRRLHPRVRMMVTPGTQEIAAQAAAEGLLEIFIAAGATLTAPGCGPCAAGRVGTVGPGEVSINTGTRNDPGRLGPGDKGIYLASPLTVAASAVAGEIVDPREFL